MRMKYNKYNNKKVNINGILFDSKKEARRYNHLKLLESAGEIKELVLQPKFLLQDNFTYKNRTYRKIEYIADFSYVRTEDNVLVIEDAKGFKTDVFKLKEKMFIKTLLEKGQEFEFNLI